MNDREKTQSPEPALQDQLSSLQHLVKRRIKIEVMLAMAQVRKAGVGAGIVAVLALAAAATIVATVGSLFAGLLGALVEGLSLRWWQASLLLSAVCTLAAAVAGWLLNKRMQRRWLADARKALAAYQGHNS